MSAMGRNLPLAGNVNERPLFGSRAAQMNGYDGRFSAVQCEYESTAGFTACLREADEQLAVKSRRQARRGNVGFPLIAYIEIRQALGR